MGSVHSLVAGIAQIQDEIRIAKVSQPLPDDKFVEKMEVSEFTLRLKNTTD